MEQECTLLMCVQRCHIYIYIYMFKNDKSMALTDMQFYAFIVEYRVEITENLQCFRFFCIFHIYHTFSLSTLCVILIWSYEREKEKDKQSFSLFRLFLFLSSPPFSWLGYILKKRGHCYKRNLKQLIRCRDFIALWKCLGVTSYR